MGAHENFRRFFMKKDYQIVVDHNASELDYVSAHWEAKWDDAGKIQNKMNERVAKVYLRDEWGIIRSYLGLKQRILDGGCGMGEWTLALSANDHKVTGIDIAEGTIRQLQKYFPQEDFQIGNLRQLAFPDDTFDVVFSWGAFEHFEDGLQPCLKEAWRVLKPGGVLFASVPFMNWRHSIRTMLAGGRGSPIDEPMRFYQWRLNREDLGLEMRLAGYEVEILRPIHRKSGIYRLVTSGLGIRAKSILFWMVCMGLACLPSFYVGHMLLGVGRKPRLNLNAA